MPDSVQQDMHHDHLLLLNDTKQQSNKDIIMHIRVESGLDDPDNLGHFLEGQVGLIH